MNNIKLTLVIIIILNISFINNALPIPGGDDNLNNNLIDATYESDNVIKTNAESYKKSTVDNSSLITNIPEISTNDLPEFERNRLNQTHEWFYHDRGLDQPPINWKMNTKLMLADDTDIYKFGLIDGMTVNIYLDISNYMNGSTIPTSNRGDIDLILYRGSEPSPIMTSTNDEGSDENIQLTSVGENNYTLKVLHDSKDSTHPNAIGYLTIHADLNNEFLANTYFEGRDGSNNPTEYSNWNYYTTSNVKTAAVTTGTDLDFYQLRASVDFGTNVYSTDAQTWGIDMYLSFSDYNNIHYVEVEAEWGNGYALVGVNPSYTKIVKILSSQTTFPVTIDKDTTYVLYAVLGSSSDTNIVDGTSRLRIYNNSLSVFESTYGTSYLSYENINIANYTQPVFNFVKYKGPSALNNYQIFASIDNISGLKSSVYYYFSTDSGVTFTKEKMTWISGNHYGYILENPSVALSSIQSYISVEQEFPLEGISAPSEPVNVTPKMYDTSGLVSLSWEQPTISGNIPITYKIYKQRSGYSEEFVGLTNELNLNFSIITSAQYYTIRVAAENFIGQVSASVIIEEPGNIDDLSGVADHESITLTFSPPVSTLNIIEYEIWRGTTNFNKAYYDKTSQTSFLDTGLEPSTTYYYLVKAVNGMGQRSSNSISISTTSVTTSETSTTSKTSVTTSETSSTTISSSDPYNPNIPSTPRDFGTSESSTPFQLPLILLIVTVFRFTKYRKNR